MKKENKKVVQKKKADVNRAKNSRRGAAVNKKTVAKEQRTQKQAIDSKSKPGV